MDDGFWVTLIVFIICFSIVGGYVINEALETPYDKCTDSCINIHEEIKKECINSCSITFCEDKEEDLK